MSPEDFLSSARQVFTRQTDEFRSTLAITIDQVQSMLPTDGSVDGETDHAALGDFASGRIDTDRFASLVVRKRAVEPATTGVIERALSTLSGLAVQGEALDLVNVSSGASLHAAVATALANIGRAFGAARVIAAVRSGRYAPETHDSDLEGFPFARWNRTERRIAPPLLIELDGADLHAGALEQFLDGSMRFVLLVRGEATAAPLVRSISPSVFVMQTGDADDLQRMLAWDGPGVAAIVPEGAARFVHDPREGDAPSDRLSVEHLPEDQPRSGVGGISLAQQLEHLRLLSALATPAPTSAATPEENEAVTRGAPAPGGSNGSSADPVDKLATWLLGAADLSDLP